MPKESNLNNVSPMEGFESTMISIVTREGEKMNKMEIEVRGSSSVFIEDRKRSSE
jgi:hypothetical protein